jgi:HSP20 family protein
MLMRFDPFREIDQMLRTANTGSRFVGMPMDAFRRGDDFIVELDLPGVHEDSIDITVERDVLEITAERAAHFEEGDQVLAAERPSGKVTRQLFLGQNLDTGKIEASYVDGVLQLRLPVAEEAKPHRIRVGTGNGRQTAVEATSS